MYANVVVLTYQSPQTQYYTYEIPKGLEGEIKIGQMVSIPFGKRMPHGVVVNLDRRVIGDIGRIRDIREIPLKQPLLLPFQIELLKWLSFYYHAPMVNCLEAMLPKIPSRLGKLEELGILGKERQVVVLVPSINRLPETLAKYPNAKNYTVYHNELKPSQRFESWLKILRGNADYVFGSRSAIFTPCPNLKQIIIYNEHDSAYKDERSPYFDTLTVAEKISALTGCEIEIIDSSPKITTYFLFKQTRFVKILQTGFELIPKVKIVNMLDERKTGNRSAVSDFLENKIKQTVAVKGKVLLFLNKKTESGHLYCRDCKHQEFVDSEPQTCPNCQSPDIFFSSLNISTLANYVKKIVPSASIRLVARGAKLSTLNSQLPTSLASLRSGPADNDRTTQQSAIEIATSSVFYSLTPQKYDLVAHIQTDSLLNIHDFNCEEKLFGQIADLKRLTKQNGLLILQTYNPDNSTIVFAETNNYARFFQSQLRERQSLSYPPFSLLVKLSIKGKDEIKLFEKAKKLFQDLNLQSTSILGPYQSHTFRETKKINILLKIKVTDYNLHTREKVVGKISSACLDKVSRDWQITVEPSSIN